MHWITYDTTTNMHRANEAKNSMTALMVVTVTHVYDDICNYNFEFNATHSVAVESYIFITMSICCDQYVGLIFVCATVGGCCRNGLLFAVCFSYYQYNRPTCDQYRWVYYFGDVFFSQWNYIISTLLLFSYACIASQLPFTNERHDDVQIGKCCPPYLSLSPQWWGHQMEKNSALLALCR